MALSAGTNLGPYEMLSPIGAGGMGEVYRARDTALDREVAIKVLPANLALDPEASARFEREAEGRGCAVAPEHPRDPRVRQPRGVAYIVTELLEGDTLRARLDAARSSRCRRWTTGSRSRGASPRRTRRASSIAT